MRDIERWTEPSGVLASRGTRDHRLAVTRIVQEAQETALAIDADAALAGRIMDRAKDLDALRLTLAQGDPALNTILSRIELNFVLKAEQHQRGLGRRFGL